MATESSNHPAADYNDTTGTESGNHGENGQIPTGTTDDVEVHVKLVLIDGPDGARLQDLQTAAIGRILRALLDASIDISKGDPR